LWHGRLGIYRGRSFTTAARERANCKINFMGIREVGWGQGGTDPVGNYTFFCGKR
jgi:hypothetical protein